ncbi:hypothetical protein DY000_02016604 [Brassica cretica]|uniref:Uncharacterized protein n=1 Tax=Brassica cretica TaxID=69181 RepID=A0ABQ7D3U9_BRACR|nr:hypothetical protein DY000_02016604 [Brassica cretica]
MAENLKWVRYGLRETTSKGRRECMDSCRIDVSEELGRYRPSETDVQSLRSDRAWLELGHYVPTERDMCSVATWRPSLARARSLRSDRAIFFGLFSDVSCFFRRALQRDKIGAVPYDGCLHTLVEGIKSFVVCLGVKFSAVCKLAGFLKTLEYWQRDKFWDLEMLEISALGLGQDLGLLLVLEGAMTNSTYIFRFSFILIPYRFKVRDRFSAYMTCMVGTEHLSKDNFSASWKC